MTSDIVAPARVHRALGVVGLGLQPATILTEFLAAAAFRAPYSFAHNTISDLGATTCTDIPYPYGPVPVCSPWHALINGGFVVAGVLLVVGAWAARPLIPPGAWREVGTVSLTVAALSTMATGLIPLDVDLGLHVLVSLPTFLVQPIGVLAWGAALRDRRGHRTLARGGIAIGTLCLAAAVAFLLLEGQPSHGGTLERLALWPALGWLAGAGWSLGRSTSTR